MSSESASEPFRFEVDSVFTITGRGTVAAGVIRAGVVHSGDKVLVLHEGAAKCTTCTGVEGIRRVPLTDPAPVGLLLPELDLSDVAPGDFIVSP